MHPLVHVSRAVVHFSGFEPLDAHAHHDRLRRAAADSGAAWGVDFQVGSLEARGRGGSHFTVTGAGPDWRTVQRVTLLDHADLMAALAARPAWRRIADGWRAAWNVVLWGGWRYPAAAWRFSFFLVYPYAVFAFAIVFCALLALAPPVALGAVHGAWSVPFAFVVGYALRRLLTRFHIFHLFDHWRTGAALATMDDLNVRGIVERQSAALAEVMRASGAMPVTVSSHSMGATFAVHALGLLLERDPSALDGRMVQITTLGSTLLQAAMLRPATLLRSRIHCLLSHPSVVWVDVQSLTDIVNFYGADLVRVLQLGSEISPPLAMSVRAKGCLSPAHFRRVRFDFLRIHRQYVMGSDRRERYDFMMFLFGPLPLTAWTAWAPAFGPDGSMPENPG